MEHTDRLTQLQTCLDQLLTQFYSSINYINRHHDFEPIAGEQKVVDDKFPVAQPEKLEADLNELARDIILKSQQIDLLIDSLPGSKLNETDQMAKVRKLQEELKVLDAEEQQVLEEVEGLLGQCDGLISDLTKEKVQISNIQRQM